MEMFVSSGANRSVLSAGTAVLCIFSSWNQGLRPCSFCLMSCTVSKKPTSILNGASPDEHTKVTSMAAGTDHKQVN